MQTQLSGEQLTLLRFISPEVTYPLQPVATAKRASEESTDEVCNEIIEEIERLRKEIKDAQEDVMMMEEIELDLEPEPGDECIFDGSVPRMEEDLNELRLENEAEIRMLECEIGELEAKLKHAN